MGRSSKKIQESPYCLIKKDDLKKIKAIKEIIGPIFNETIFFPKQFKYWINSQLESIRKNEFITNRFTFKQNGSIKFDLSVEINDLVLMSVLKDKVYQVYSKHIKESIIINETKTRLKNNDFIDSSVENVTQNDLLNGIIGNVVDHAKWLTSFSINLPGFDKINNSDFILMVNHATLLTIGFQINEFFYDNELYHITKNGYQMTRNRMNLAFGSFHSYLYFITHIKLKQLCLSDYEKALFYPVILCCCDGI